MKHNRPTDAIKEEIVKKHFDKKISQTDLAKEYGISRRSIHLYCKVKGVSPLKKMYKLNDKKIIKMYVEEKKSVFQIAKILGVATRPITKRLREHGVEKKVSKRYKWA